MPKPGSRLIQLQACFAPCWVFMRGAASSEAAPGTPLHRDADRDSDVGISAIEQVIAVVDVGDIDVVIVVPVIPPIFRPRVNQTEPIATACTQEQRFREAKTEWLCW